MNLGLGIRRRADKTAGVGLDQARLDTVGDALALGRDELSCDRTWRGGWPMLIVGLVIALASSAPHALSESRWASAFVNAASGGGGSGWLLLEIVVDADGRPVSCRAAKGNADATFKDRACKVAMRTQYVAASDESGKPIAGMLNYTVASGGYEAAAATARIDAVLTVDHIPSGVQSQVTSLHLIINADGGVGSCTVGRSSGSAALDHVACSYLATSSFNPVSGANGVPVRSFRVANVAFAAQPR